MIDRSNGAYQWETAWEARKCNRLKPALIEDVYRWTRWFKSTHTTEEETASNIAGYHWTSGIAKRRQRGIRVHGKIWERADYRQRSSIKTILEVRRKKWKLHEQWMRAVSDMPKEKSTEASIMEQMNHQEMLNFIRTVKLPYKINKMLNITVEEEHERRENDETRIDLYLQILRGCNLPGPELEMKVLDAGYASLYHYNSLSAEDHTWNLIHPRKRVNQVILVTFRSIRQGYPARNTAGHTKEQNSIWQERFRYLFFQHQTCLIEYLLTLRHILRGKRALLVILMLSWQIKIRIQWWFTHVVFISSYARLVLRAIQRQRVRHYHAFLSFFLSFFSISINKLLSGPSLMSYFLQLRLDSTVGGVTLNYLFNVHQ